MLTTVLLEHCLSVFWHELDLTVVSRSVGNKGLYTRVNPSLDKDHRNVKKKFRNVQFFKVVIDLHLNHFAPLRHTPKFLRYCPGLFIIKLELLLEGVLMVQRVGFPNFSWRMTGGMLESAMFQGLDDIIGVLTNTFETA